MQCRIAKSKMGSSLKPRGKACVFTEATTRANINTGETRATIFGKIKKWFTDLAPLLIEQRTAYNNGAYGISNVVAIRRGKLVQLFFRGGPCTLATGSFQTIVTLEEQYRPSADTPSAVIVPQTQSSAPIRVRVTSGGALQMSPHIAAPTGTINDTYWYFLDY